jgi:hypothetical protein
MPEFPVFRVAVDPDAAVQGNHAERRKSRRQRRRYARKVTLTTPIAESTIPPGSLISDSTLKAIAAGELSLAKKKYPSTRPSLKERKLQSRIDRMRAYWARHPQAFNFEPPPALIRTEIDPDA